MVVVRVRTHHRTFFLNAPGQQFLEPVRIIWNFPAFLILSHIRVPLGVALGIWAVQMLVAGILWAMLIRGIFRLISHRKSAAPRRSDSVEH